MNGNAETAQIRHWRGNCVNTAMFARIARLFTITTKFEAFMVIYGLGLGATERGAHYLRDYPGIGGWMLFAVCPLAVFMAGARILESVERGQG
jgi:hypothetical protein